MLVERAQVFAKYLTQR